MGQQLQDGLVHSKPFVFPKKLEEGWQDLQRNVVRHQTQDPLVAVPRQGAEFGMHFGQVPFNQVLHHLSVHEQAR